MLVKVYDVNILKSLGEWGSVKVGLIYTQDIVLIGVRSALYI